MPHVHSPAALVERRRRAFARGFVAPKAVQADPDILRRSQEVGRSLAVHKKLESFNGTHDHSAGVALLRARPVLDVRTRQRYRNIVKGNEARHSAWAPSSSVEISDVVDAWSSDEDGLREARHTPFTKSNTQRAFGIRDLIVKDVAMVADTWENYYDIGSLRKIF